MQYGFNTVTHQIVFSGCDSHTNGYKDYMKIFDSFDRKLVELNDS